MLIHTLFHVNTDHEWLGDTGEDARNLVSAHRTLEGAKAKAEATYLADYSAMADDYASEPEFLGEAPERENIDWADTTQELPGSTWITTWTSNDLAATKCRFEIVLRELED